MQRSLVHPAAATDTPPLDLSWGAKPVPWFHSISLTINRSKITSNLHGPQHLIRVVLYHYRRLRYMNILKLVETTKLSHCTFHQLNSVAWFDFLVTGLIISRPPSRTHSSRASTLWLPNCHASISISSSSVSRSRQIHKASETESWRLFR